MNIVILQRIGYPNHLFKPQKQLYHEETIDIFHSIIVWNIHSFSGHSPGDVNLIQGSYILTGSEVELHPGTTGISGDGSP